MMSQQERLCNSWKRELEKSAAAYEALITKMKEENTVLLRENEHWRKQLNLAQAMKSERINKRLKEVARKQKLEESPELMEEDSSASPSKV